MSPSRRQRWIAVGLMALTFAIYWLTFLGQLRSIDEMAILSVTESLVKHGTLTANPIAFTYIAGQESLVEPGPSGDFYPHKGLLPSLLAAPLYTLALQLPSMGLAQTALLLNPILTALTAGLVYLLAIRWGFSDRAGVATAMSFSCGTLAWHYGQTLYTEPSAALAWVGAAYLLIMALASPRGIRWIAVAGGLVGLSAGASYPYGIAVPVFAIYLVLQIRQTPGRSWRRLAAFGGGCLAGLLVWALANQLRFGNWLGTGYSLQTETLRLAGAATRLYGLVLSPYRGLIWYVPFALVMPAGCFALCRRRALEGLLCAGLTLAVIGIYSLWTVWWGAVNWGPRYLVPLMPFLCLGLVPIWEWILDRRGSRLLRGAFGALVVLSFGVQIVSVLTNYVPYDFENWQRYSQFLIADAPISAIPLLYDVRLSPLWVQTQVLGQGNIESAWVGDGQALAACVLGVLITSAVLVMLTRTRRSCALVLTSLGAMSLIVLWTLPRVTTARARPPMRELVTYIQANARPDDVIVQMMPDVYTEFATLYRSGVPVYGLPREAPLRPELMGVLERLAREHRAIWLVSTGSPPADPQNGAEVWLVQHTFKAVHEYWAKVRLSVFAAPTADDGPVVPRADCLGESIRLISFSLPRRSWHPGDIVPLTLTWEAITPVQQNAVVFVHLYDAAGKLVAQRDAQPLDGYAPTSAWRIGEPIADRQGVLLPNNIAPGEYALNVGLYDAATGQRLVIDPPQRENRIPLGTVRVEP
jgi:hypothetical protein